MTARLWTRRAVVRGVAGLVFAGACGLVLPGRVEAASCPWGCGMPYGPLHRYLWATGVAPAEQHRIITRESGWNPSAQNPTSSAGGLCQYLDWIWVWLEEEGLANGSRFNGYDSIDAMNNCLRAGYWWMWACGPDDC